MIAISAEVEGVDKMQTWMKDHRAAALRFTFCALGFCGKLGYVQRVGASPGETGPDETEVYGVGAFLLAGSELHRLARKK